MSHRSLAVLALFIVAFLGTAIEPATAAPLDFRGAHGASNVNHRVDSQRAASSSGHRSLLDRLRMLAWLTLMAASLLIAASPVAVLRRRSVPERFGGDRMRGAVAPGRAPPALL